MSHIKAFAIGLGILAIGGILFWKRKAITNMKDFIITFLPLAQHASDVFGFKDPYFLLAQMYAENGGNSYLLNNANNVGSLISRMGNTKIKPNQYWKGAEIGNPNNGLWFRKYDTLMNGMLDYAHTLSAYYQMNQAHDVNQYASKISQSKYIDTANGDNRAEYAMNIINAYNNLKNS